jgi:hypothetical protein
MTFGCGTQYSYYHSTADSPYYSHSILTDAKLIMWPEDIRYSFGIVVATDVKSSDSSPHHYALFVPGAQVSGVTEISELKIAYAAPVLKKDLEFLAIELDKILRNWGNKSSFVEATYYEFYSAPEQDIVRLSENVIVWYPSVKFGFQNTEKTLIGVLLIGPDSFRFKYTFDDMKEMGAFQKVLSEAVSEIRIRERKTHHSTD